MTATSFDTRAGFREQLHALLAGARASLDLFDPDFALFELGAPETDATLRSFLRNGGLLRLAMHTDAHLLRHAPRFLRLLRDYGHGIECRTTPRGLRQLTDSFAIADGRHIVRRFHSDHARGVAELDAPQETELYAMRFSAIWAETVPGLHATPTGL